MSYLHPIWSHSLSMGDVVHCGGLPTAEDGVSHTGVKYEHLLLYFLMNAANLPENTIFCNNYGGISFVKVNSM